MTPRLCLANLDRVPERLRPGYDPRSLDVGIVHLGVGAFHRAHQAVYTEDALAAEPGRWGICAASQRSSAAVDQLGPQDGLYSVLERGDGAAPVRVVGVIRQVISARDDWPLLRSRLADPTIDVVTLTVTEKGYRHIPSTGRLDLTDADVELDLAGRPPHTVVGQLVRGLQARRGAESGAVSIVSCDNLPGNGAILHSIVADFVDALPSAERAGLSDWVEEHVAFPATMVDRITPSTTDADRIEVERALGVEDRAVVVTEPFRMWVIENRFAAARPAWEAAGALLTDDVRSYELLKLRMLNGSHSALAYLGALAGYDTIAAAVADPLLERAVRHLLRDEIAPSLRPPPGIDLAGYGSQLLRRYANPALGHRTLQVAMDGTQKLPLRLLDPLRERVALGLPVTWICLTLAAWMRFVWLRRDDEGRELAVDDPLADRISAVLAGVTSAAVVVERLLGLQQVFGELGAEPVICGELTTRLTGLVEQGVARSVGSLV